MTPVNNPTEGNRKGKETAGRISSEYRDTAIANEVEHGTEGYSRQLMTRSGTQILATHEYKKNPDSAVGNELDLLNEGDDTTKTNTGRTACRGWKGAGGICASGLSHDHHRRDST